MNFQYVNSLVAAQAPIDGVSFGKPADKSTWRIDFQAAATPAQRAAAQSAIDNYVDGEAGEVDFGKQSAADALDMVALKIALSHENRIRVLEGKVVLTLSQFKAAVKALL